MLTLFDVTLVNRIDLRKRPDLTSKERLEYLAPSPSTLRGDHGFPSGDSSFLNKSKKKSNASLPTSRGNRLNSR
jgi:hypothetical protein